MSYYLSPDHLYELVKSMTPSEKRYFRLQSSLYSGDKAYLRLFDILDRQEVFDESAIRQQLSDKISTNNVSVLKKYLFEHIIKVLKSYGTYRDPDSELSDMIETYKILEFKGMHKLSERVLQDAKKRAFQEDAFLKLYYILIQQMINLGQSKSDDIMNTNTLYDLSEERKKILEIIRNYSFVGDRLYIQRNMIRKMGKARDTFLEKALRENIEPLIRMDKKQLLSRTAEGMYNMAMSDYYFVIGDVERALHYLSDYIRKQAFPKDTSKIEIQYLNEYSYYFNVSLRSMYFEDFETHLQRFRKLISSRNTPIDIVIFERWLYYSITWMNLHGRFREATEHFRREAKTFNRLKSRFTRHTLISIEYSLAYSSFGTGDYENALRSVLKVIGDAGTDSEVYVFARLLSILIYYEMENWGGLEYATRSTYRMLVKKERLFRSEKIILAFIRQLPSIQSNSQLLTLFSGLHDELNLLFSDSIEADIEYYIHIRAWLRSKIESVDFASCVIRQVRKWQQRQRKAGLYLSNSPDTG